jgi:hypothetical protein
MKMMDNITSRNLYKFVLQHHVNNVNEKTTLEQIYRENGFDLEEDLFIDEVVINCGKGSDNPMKNVWF